jgi:hypothetical protein
LPAALVAGALAIQACAQVPSEPFGIADASDPNHRVPSAGYRPVLTGYSSQRPVDPLPWTERNQSVAPPPRKDGQ